MEEDRFSDDPDWDTPLTFMLTPAAIIHSLFATADAVHTGWDTCIDHTLAVTETTVVDEASGNHCRLVEQEYVETEGAEENWHDWSVELKIGATYVSAHWRVLTTGSPSDWDWCAGEAEKAFMNACVLFGRRVRRGLVIDEASHSGREPRTHH